MRFQKLEEDRQRAQARTRQGNEEARKRPAAAAAHEATRSPKQQKRGGGARERAGVEGGFGGRDPSAPAINIGSGKGKEAMPVDDADTIIRPGSPTRRGRPRA